MVRFTLAALMLLLGCAGADPLGSADSPHIGPVRVEGTVYRGNGGPADGVGIKVELLPLGCAGDALIAQGTYTARDGGFSAAFPTDTFPHRLCARVTSDAWPGQSWDDNVVVQDSVIASTGASLTIRYDWARARVSTYVAPADSLKVLPHKFEFSVYTGAGTQVIKGADLQPVAPMSSTWRFSAPFETAITGELQVAVGYSGAIGSGGGVTEFQLAHDRLLSINAQVGTRNPGNGCFGCAKVAAFPLIRDGEKAADSLFVVFGYVPASHVVVF